MYKAPPPLKIKVRGRNGQLVSLDIHREGLDGMFLTELTSLLAAQADGGPRVLRKTERAEDKHETAVGGEIVLKKTDFQVGASRRGDEDQEKVKIRTKEEWGKTVKRRPITMKEGTKENTPSTKAVKPTRTKETALNDITNTARAEAPFLSELETAIAKSRGGRPHLTPIPVLEDKGEEESAQSTSPWGPRLRGKTPNNAISQPSPPRRSKKLELELTALSSGRRIPEGGMSLAAMAILERIKAEKMQEDAAVASEDV
ncbi:hypothetical protein EWM64_g7451 [Hericium alpestre]|uniref:Uncharacterized protein n=1 Tax=Hericium alpestre TaxID=135208 RepID=A0A4Y9ZSV2_9AGAM|nr:hypothetical protein EWM64_g7451 [Hericium alpestre]